ncbi:hypothetical protein DACRYDRAFT_25409 [Dacryopinax primogenitus]|uniref:Uncharacterized protein n=1 Tax=Dacryopinax primogenitus (strain DJM 731) TaxID=1858805 RepID=M5FUN0_DACPD|nr:uncharacterized protein DACRYDRAFT_25409 [Dacryopinax primogenitus]EJT96971.1 hypothetical protein DACRYDRAFT_25409 [Dacryopinax primogenitus]
MTSIGDRLSLGSPILSLIVYFSRTGKRPYEKDTPQEKNYRLVLAPLVGCVYNPT